MIDAPITPNDTPQVEISLCMLWNDKKNFISLPYDKSCCLHLAFGIESNDSYFRIGELSLAISSFVSGGKYDNVSYFFPLNGE